jgi:MFS family permease
MAAVIAVGSGLGTVLAGPVVGALNWRWLLWLPMILMLATAAVAHFVVPESPVRVPGRINWLAATLLGGWLVALLLPLSEGSTWGWTSPGVLGLFVVAVGLFVAWMTVENRTRNPVIDMRIMRVRTVWTTNLVALLFGASMFSVWAFIPQLAQTPTSTGYGLGASVTRSGLLLVPMLITMAAGSSLSGPIAKKLSFPAQLTAGSAVTAVASAGFAFLHDSAWLIATSATLYGLGLGLAYAAIASLIVQGVPASQTGVASGMNANIRIIGGAIGAAVMSSILTGTLQPDGYPAERGYVIGFGMATVLAVAASALAFRVPRTVTAPAEQALVEEVLPLAPART